MLNTNNARGLTNLLKHFTTDTPLEQYPEIQVFQMENDRRLSFLSAGTRVPNPLELLGSNKFHQLIDAARESYDIIIVDCPPYGMVSDCIPVSMLAYAARSAMEDLKRNGGRIIGTVLTKVEEAESSKYGYGNYYGSYYGDSAI